jgi:hypothetical protein
MESISPKVKCDKSGRFDTCQVAMKNSLIEIKYRDGSLHMIHFNDQTPGNHKEGDIDFSSGISIRNMRTSGRQSNVIIDNTNIGKNVNNSKDKSFREWPFTNKNDPFKGWKL